jgi:hypothetical protein
MNKRTESAKKQNNSEKRDDIATRPASHGESISLREVTAARELSPDPRCLILQTRACQQRKTS